MLSLKSQIRARAHALGFALCGFARIRRPPHAEFVEQWVEAGNAAGMAYIGRKLAKRLDPTLILRGAQTMISVGFRYAPPPLPRLDWKQSLRGRVAAYALEADYHKVMDRKLRELQVLVEELLPGNRTLSYVDTGAILEREWAALGGVGWFGKNTNLLHKREGSWFFVGELITTAAIEPDTPQSDHCGTCTRCLDLCPTGALAPGYLLDARRCISYWTIEHRGAIPHDMRSRLGNWVFGCDECQEVCPWNDKLEAQADPRAVAYLTPHLPELLGLDEDGFEARYRGSSLWRTRRQGLARNAAIALGNSGNPQAVPSLAQALRDDPSPLVRGHAAWALGCFDDAAARRALEICRAGESDADARAEIEQALARH